MIIMTVADQHYLNGRQVFKEYAHPARPTRPGKRHRAGAFAPDGVGEDVQPTRELQQPGAVPHERSRRFVRADPRRQRGRDETCLDPFRPGGQPAAQNFPAQHVEQRTSRRDPVEVVKFPPVKMGLARGGGCVIFRGHPANHGIVCVEMKEVTVYTDGGCIGNPGPGGWGAVLMYGGRRREISGGEPATTTTGWSCPPPSGR